MILLCIPTTKILHIVSSCKKIGGKKTITVDVHPYETIGNIKSKIQEKADISRNNIHVLFGGQKLMDHKTLYDYNINKESNLVYIPILRGNNDDNNQMLIKMFVFVYVIFNACVSTDLYCCDYITKNCPQQF